MTTLFSRLRGSLMPAVLHFSISAAVALSALAIIYAGWYPGALAHAQGVSHLVLILIGVDVVIGPLITLIVYVPGKKSLRFDLLVIAALQTAALLYGLKAIEGGRPAYLVFNVDRFDVVAVKDVVPESLILAAEAMQPSWLGPRWVAARLPNDPDQRSEVLFSAIQGGADLPQMPEFFVPIEGERTQMLARLRPMSDLRNLNGLDTTAWQSLLAEFGRTESDLGYLPMVANAKDGAVILDAKTGDVLGIRLLTPSFAAPAKPQTPESSSPKSIPTPAPSKSPAALQGLG